MSGSACSTVPGSIDVDINGVLQLDIQAQLGSGLSLREGVATCVDCGAFAVGGPTSSFLSGADGYVDFAGDVAVGVASPAVLAGDVAITVASPAVAGAASLADLAGDVAVRVASPTVAGAASFGQFCWGITVEVASLAVAGVADLAGGVTVGAASLADAGVVPLADLDGSVAGEVTYLAELVRVGTDQMTLPQECGVRGCSVFGDLVYCDSEADFLVVRRQMLGARRCLRFGAILFVSMLTMWAIAWTVLTCCAGGR